MKKLWIDLEGNAIAVPDSHEQWANRHGHELEALLDAGWVRIQSVPPPYLLIDFNLPLNAKQAVAVAQVFKNHFDKILVEFGSKSRSFTDGVAAMGYVVGVK